MKTIKTITKVVETKEKPTCCVVEDNCLAPANVTQDAKIRIRTWCYRCGQPVCRNCSKKIHYFNFGIQRICSNCLEEIKD